MKSKWNRIALVGLLVAAAAHPATAGVVYVPAAGNVNVGGVSRTGQMLLSNQDVANVRGVRHRFIQAGVAGSPLPATTPWSRGTTSPTAAT